MEEILRFLLKIIGGICWLMWLVTLILPYVIIAAKIFDWMDISWKIVVITYVACYFAKWVFSIIWVAIFDY